MINNDVLENHLSSIDGVSYVRVEGDGYHYTISIVSDVFEGKSKVARQQWVYACMKDYITSGQVHAVNIKSWTKSEWEKQNG